MSNLFITSMYFKYFRIKILCPTTFVAELHMGFFSYVCSRYLIDNESMYLLVYCETTSFQTVESVFLHINEQRNVAICPGDWRQQLDLITSKSIWLTPATSSGVLSKGFGQTTSFSNSSRLIPLSSFRNKKYPTYQ